MDDNDKKLLITTCYGHFLAHFNMLVFPALILPLTQSLNLSLAQVVDLGFWMYLFFGISALPWGLLADRIGAKPLLLAFYAGAGICGFIAAIGVDSPLVLRLAMAGVGLFSGIYHPAGLGLIARGAKRIPMAMAYNGIFGNLGLAGGPLFTGLVNWLWGPAAAFMVLGGFNLLGVPILMGSGIPEGERPRNEAADNAPGAWAPFVILLTAMMLAGITYRATTVTLPPYLELNLPALLAGLEGLWPGMVSGNLMATVATSFIFLVGALGQYSGGLVGERLDPRWGYLIFHSLTLPFLLLIALTSNWALVACALFYIFFLVGMQPMENTLVAKLSPPAWKHTAYGSKFVLVFGMGALAVKLIGFPIVTWGIASVFLVMGGVTVIMLLNILFLISRTKPISQKQ